jgi:hypothetical protein
MIYEPAWEINASQFSSKLHTLRDLVLAGKKVDGKSDPYHQ